MPYKIKFVPYYAVFSKGSLNGYLNTGLLYLGKEVEIPKKELLIFDRVAVPNLSSWLSRNGRGEEYLHIVADIEYLAENNIFYEPEAPKNHKDFFDTIYRQTTKLDEIPTWVKEELRCLIRSLTLTANESNDSWAMASVGLPRGDRNSDEELNFDLYCFITENEHSDIITRIINTYYSTESREQFIPIVYHGVDQYIRNAKSTMAETEVTHVAINTIKIPTKQTSLQEIIEFKNDDNLKHMLHGFRLWMYEISKNEESISYLNDKLNHQLEEYNRYIDRASKHFHAGVIETLVVGFARVIENILKLNLENIAKMPFELRSRKAHLTEMEADAPGREVAYIHKATDYFRK